MTPKMALYQLGRALRHTRVLLPLRSRLEEIKA